MALRGAEGMEKQFYGVRSVNMHWIVEAEWPDSVARPASTIRRRSAVRPLPRTRSKSRLISSALKPSKMLSDETELPYRC
jgi:hypothetical protein